METFRKKVSRRTFIAMAAAATAGCAMAPKRFPGYAQKMGPRADYPTVVIGAGLGGLGCGAYLARQGIPVTVVEQHTVPGGYATSFRRGAGKFNFEVSLHGTSIHDNTSARILKDLGVLESLKLVELPEFYSLKVPGQEIMAVPQRDPEAYVRLLSARFPQEERGIRGFVETMVGIAEEADRLSRENPTAEGALYKLRFPGRFPRMWKVRNKTLAELLSDHVEDGALREHLAALWGYHGLPPSRLSGFYYAVATGDYLKNGSYYIRERSQDLSNALAKAIEDAGGKVMYGARAERILLEGGSVTGVQLNGGGTLPARAVVSNASAITSSGRMLPEDALPWSYRKKIDLVPAQPSRPSWCGWG
jgi:prolycopene isomerase